MTKVEELTEYLNQYQERMNDGDSLIVIAHDLEDNDICLALNGYSEGISAIVSNNSSLNHEGESEEALDEIKKVFLNTAYNICNQDDHVLETFLNGLLMLKNNKNNQILN